MKILYDECLEAIKNNRCSECNDFYQCSVADFIELRCQQSKAETIEECISELKSRLLDAITREHLESVTNLINDVAEMVKEKKNETNTISE